MNKILKMLTAMALIFIISMPSLAQSMTPETDQMLKSRVKERVALMNSYIKYMADKRNDRDTRLYYNKKALPLFIGKGYSYISDGVEHEGVMMQTTSTNTNKVTSKLMRNYFRNLIDLRYTDIKITSTAVADMKISDLKKIAPNKYVCACQYVQYFYGYRDGTLVYRDRTVKRIECMVDVEEVEGGQEYIVQLGDVEALHTERI